MSRWGLPSVPTQSAVGLAVGARAYRIARFHAAQGVDPHLAAQYGARAADATFCFWVGVFPPAVFFGLFMWKTPVLIGWKVVLVALALVIWRRLRTYLNTSPIYRCRYAVPTWVFCTAYVLWLVGLVVGYLVYLWYTV